MAVNKQSASMGLFASMEQTGKALKEEKFKGTKEDKSKGIEELTSKRSYELKKTTIRRLTEMKALYYDLGVTYNEIVDEAINKLYDLKKSEQ